MITKMITTNIKKIEGIKLPKNAALFQVETRKYVLRHYRTNVLIVELDEEYKAKKPIKLLIDEHDISATTLKAIRIVAEYFDIEEQVRHLSYTNKNSFTEEFRGYAPIYRKELGRRYNKQDWNDIAEELKDFDFEEELLK